MTIKFSSLLFGCCSVGASTNLLSLSGYNVVCVLIFYKLLTLISEQIVDYCELKWLNEFMKLLLCVKLFHGCCCTLHSILLTLKKFQAFLQDYKKEFVEFFDLGL